MPKKYLLPRERPSPLVNLRAYLLHCAKKPNDHREVFKHYYQKSQRRLHQQRFFLGNLFGHKLKTKKGAVRYTVIWIDPYNFDCLVLDHVEKLPKFKNLYGLIL